MVLDLEREALKPAIDWERSATVAFAAGAIIGIGGSMLLAPHLPRLAKLSSLLLGATSSLSLTYSIAARQKNEKIINSLDAAQGAYLKQSLAAEVAKETTWAKIDAQRQLAAKISRLPVHEQGRWIAQYQLQGIIPQLVPQSVPEDRGTRLGIPATPVEQIGQEAVDRVVNPGAMAVLESIEAQYPGYVRLDEQWVDDLCYQSANPDMSARSNHHFYIGGGTQSGKSTLAGVLIRKIASLSEGTPAVVGSDPKDGVTRWLCKFSQKFDGFERLTQWILFATDLINRRKTEVKKVGGHCSGIPELFLIQDEVDSAYGGGKGLPGMVDKKTAESLQAFWNYIIKFTAGLRCHGIFMGQNPLSGATGFSRPEYKNVCFIALGQVSTYILDHPNDFLNVKKDVLEVLKNVCELFDSEGLRYALIVPTRGKPFVALIPEFDIEGMQVRDSSGEGDVPVTPAEDPVASISAWYHNLPTSPSDEDLIRKWYELTGVELNVEGLDEVRRYLQERRGLK